MARLGDFVKIRTGKLDANAADESGMYPFFTCAMESLRINTFSYDCECVLVAGNGDLNVKYYNGKFDAYQRTYIIESLDTSKLLVKYLYFFLEMYIEILRKQAIGGVIKYIKLGNLTEADIPVPSIATQQNVIDILEKAQLVIDIRTQQLSKLDELIKSRFIEMFGDPNTPKNVVTLTDAFDIRDDLRKPLNDVERSKMREGLLYPYYGANGQVDAINNYITEYYALCLAEDCGSYEDTLNMGEELAPLITPDEDDPKAMRFDALLYAIELAFLAGKSNARARKDLYKKVAAIADVANIPEIQAQSEVIDRILHTDYLDHADMGDWEHIRKSLRNLIKYIPIASMIYEPNFDDEILSIEWKESELENDDLQNYKAKAAFYVRQHQDNTAIAKLRSNIPLNAEDVKELEKILWSEVGTKAEYEAEYGQKPLGELVREIVGMDMNAAKAAFARYLNDVSLNARQIYFVNQIVEYIVRNGVMKDLSVLQEAPFTDQGSVVEIFTDMSVWMGIRHIIENINANVLAA